MLSWQGFLKLTATNYKSFPRGIKAPVSPKGFQKLPQMDFSCLLPLKKNFDQTGTSDPHHNTALPDLVDSMRCICWIHCSQANEVSIFLGRAQCPLNATLPSTLPHPLQYLPNPLRVPSLLPQGYPQLILVSPSLLTNLLSTFLTWLGRQKNRGDSFKVWNWASIPRNLPGYQAQRHHSTFRWL